MFRLRFSIRAELAEGMQENIVVQVFRQFMSALIFRSELKGNLRRESVDGIL